MEKLFCVISHTHWDREWYQSLDQFRLRLVDLMDHLLEILEENPAYIFHLDAQTIVLEDYLEIRPYQKPLLERHVREGRILVGPWYVQNDFYLTSGEATVRNLLIGTAIAESYGHCAKVGYTPDQFGLISQLPQVFRGFGIDNCVFGRGYVFPEQTPEGVTYRPGKPEFTWRAAAGTEVTAILMPFWYNNAQRFSEDIDKAYRMLGDIERSFEGLACTPYLLLMNGVDHLEAQENLLPILQQLNQRLPAGKRIEQYDFERYIADFQAYVQRERLDLGSYEGEMRNGFNDMVLQGTLSSRVYLKQQNVKAQNQLSGYLEPLYALIRETGGDKLYPRDYLLHLWKSLIENHPHDSICGCSIDQVHDNMEDRFGKIDSMAEGLLERGLDFISAHVDRAGLDGNDYLLTLFNPALERRAEPVEATLRFPVEENVAAFQILDEAGEPVPYAVLNHKRAVMRISSPINLPGSLDVDEYAVRLFAEVEGLAYRAYVVRPGAGTGLPAGSLDGRAIENEYLALAVREDGRIDLTDKVTGRKYEDALYLLDQADYGNSYTFLPAPHDRVITSRMFRPEVRKVSNDGLVASIRLHYDLCLPVCYDAENDQRSAPCAITPVTLTLSLAQGSPRLDIAYELENRSQDHRLRLVANTGFATHMTLASEPFDALLRDNRDRVEGFRNGDQPNDGFIAIGDGEAGLAWLTAGNMEYEHAPEGQVMVTLLRATGVISGDRVTPQAPAWYVPGNQCLRRLSGRLALLPFAGAADAAALGTVAKAMQMPMLAYYQPYDVRKFSGGRPCVQDSAVAEIFFRPDPYAHLRLPRSLSLARIEGQGLVLSAVKRGEREAVTVLRVQNLSDRPTALNLAWHRELRRARRLRLDETPVAELPVSGPRVGPVDLAPREILTLAVES